MSQINDMSNNTNSYYNVSNVTWLFTFVLMTFITSHLTNSYRVRRKHSLAGIHWFFYLSYDPSPRHICFLLDLHLYKLANLISWIEMWGTCLDHRDFYFILFVLILSIQYKTYINFCPTFQKFLAVVSINILQEFIQ